MGQIHATSMAVREENILYGIAVFSIIHRKDTYILYRIPIDILIQW